MSRQALLDNLADAHELQLNTALENLENEIIDLLNTTYGPVPSVEGEIIQRSLTKFKIADTKRAIQLRNDLKQKIESIYLKEADSMVRDYDKIANEFMKQFGELKLPDKFKSLTKVDLETINALKYQSFSGFEDLGNRYLTDISANVYQNALTGRPFKDMVKDIRGKLTGVKDRAGKPMSSHAGQLAHDSVMQFDGQFTIHKAKEAGLKHFKYTGTLVGTTRDFCKRHIGRTYNEKQIRAIWTGNWAGKSSGDPFIVRGGYRCRHTWLPVDKDWDIRDIT